MLQHLAGFSWLGSHGCVPTVQGKTVLHELAKGRVLKTTRRLCSIQQGQSPDAQLVSNLQLS